MGPVSLSELWRSVVRGLLFPCFLVFPQGAEALQFRIEPSAGVEVADLSWGIGGGPHPRSFVNYEEVRAIRAGAEIQYSKPLINAWQVAVVLDGHLGSAFSGNAQDSDFEWDTHQEYSRSIAEISGTALWHLRGGVGVQYGIERTRFLEGVALLVGWEQLQRTLRM